MVLRSTASSKAPERVDGVAPQTGSPNLIDIPDKLTVLADTSYGACCVDEVAAEHVDAEVVVHYGRSCLSPTARLPVIYVFTSKPLDLDATITCFKNTYPSMDEKVILMADVPYSHHIENLYAKLTVDGYRNLFPTEVKRDPSSLIPNRTIPLTGNDQILAAINPDKTELVISLVNNSEQPQEYKSYIPTPALIMAKLGSGVLCGGMKDGP